jgi:hypothetical protein
LLTLIAVLGVFLTMAVVPAGAAPYVGPEITQQGSEFTDWSGPIDPDVGGWEVDGEAIFTF